MKRLLLMDAGNTRIKFAAASAPTGLGQLPTLDADLPGSAMPSDEVWPIGALQAALADQLRLYDGIHEVLWCSVLGTRFEPLMQAACEALKISQRRISPTNNPLMRTRYADPFSLGQDRWALSLAVAHRAQLEGSVAPQLAVSLGTATTVDLVLPGTPSEHAGGWIAPGVHTMLSSLAQQTAQLPMARLTDVDWPTRTHDAIGAGVLHSQVGLIAQACRVAEQHTGQTPQVWLSGGHAQAMLPHWPSARLLERGVMEGLWVDAACQAFGAAP